ncbi:serine acetyltransferase [Pseudoduganella sp. FT93W]|uniref:Serine acetyltransferase n=1 Tax=Duganella fentianensis TaxID=2692177 RepID=A0A845I1B6_9BURK|nr:serine acetyltransferase [Duganella fentianensis]
MLNRILFSVALPPSVRMGKNVVLAYQGLSTVVHAQASIGDDVYIGPQVIIGGRSGESLVPVIEAGAYIGAGARVLGPVTVGRNALVAAGAVVLADVAPGQAVAGIPARPIKMSRGEAGRDT